MSSSHLTPSLVIEKLRTEFGAAIGEAYEFRASFSVAIEASHIRAVAAWLKHSASFEMLSDLSGVDHLGEEPRFEVVYVLYSLTHNCHLRLKVRVPEDNPELDSVVPVWTGA